MNISYVLLEQNNGKRITKTNILIKNGHPHPRAAVFHPIITADYSLCFHKKTPFPPAVVEKIKVFGSVLFE